MEDSKKIKELESYIEKNKEKVSYDTYVKLTERLLRMKWDEAFDKKMFPDLSDK